VLLYCIPSSAFQQQSSDFCNLRIELKVFSKKGKKDYKQVFQNGEKSWYKSIQKIDTISYIRDILTAIKLSEFKNVQNL
jgi:hypothetical protein